MGLKRLPLFRVTSVWDPICAEGLHHYIRQLAGWCKAKRRMVDLRAIWESCAREAIEGIPEVGYEESARIRNVASGAIDEMKFRRFRPTGWPRIWPPSRGAPVDEALTGSPLDNDRRAKRKASAFSAVDGQPALGRGIGGYGAA